MHRSEYDFDVITGPSGPPPHPAPPPVPRASAGGAGGSTRGAEQEKAPAAQTES